MERKRLNAIVSTKDDAELVPDYANNWRIPRIKFGVTHLLKQPDGKPYRKVIFHGFTHLGNLVAWLLSVRYGGELVLTITGMGRAFSRTTATALMQRFLVLSFYRLAQFRAKAMITQNDRDFHLMSRIVKPSRSTLLRTAGSGLQENYFSQLAKDKRQRLRVGFFSRALPEKEVEEYYAIARAVEEKRPGDFEFVHAGHPGVGDFSKQAICATARAHGVQYSPFKVDARNDVLQCDIIFLPSSYREGLSRILIESMLAGNVVVAKRTSGAEDHIINGVNGYIFKESSEPLKILEEINRDAIEKIGRNAKRYALENFQSRDVDKVYLSAYQLQ